MVERIDQHPNETISEKFRVICLIRPPNSFQINGIPTDASTSKPSHTFLTPSSSHDDDNDNEHDECRCIKKYTKAGSILYSREGDNFEKSFQVDACLGPNDDIKTLYQDHIDDIVKGVRNGYHGTIMAYGQTGSGKTFTIRGRDSEIQNTSTSSSECDSSHNGILPLALRTLFQNTKDGDDIEKNPHHQDNKPLFYVSYFQMYCEVLYDLLADDSAEDGISLPIREKNNGEVFIENLTQIPVSSHQKCMQAIERGDRIGEAHMNRIGGQRNRSHAVIIIRMKQRNDDATNCKSQNQKVIMSQLTFVDLAGSERVKRSGVKFQKLEEVKAVNLSLSALNNCIAALSSPNRNHIPYRDSKLTRILQPSLRGTSRTAIIVCVCPHSDDEKETLGSLLFAHRSSQLKITARRNDYVDYEKLYGELQKKMDYHDDKVHTLQIHIEKLERDLEQSSEAKKALEQNVMELSRKLHNFDVQASLSKTDETTIALNMKDAVEQANCKWREEIKRLQIEHESELCQLKTRYDEKLKAYKNAASLSSAREYELENELEKEKEQHLSALQKARTLSEKVKENKTFCYNRINELLAQVNEYRDMYEEIKDRYNEQEKKYTSEMREMAQKVGEMNLARSNSNHNSISQDVLFDMKKVFTDTVEKLSERVKLLEKTPVVSVSLWFY